MRPSGRESSRPALALLGLLLALAGGCNAPVAKPNVVLIVMDTARPDHLSCYGYERRTTPFLETLAAEGRIYDDATSTSGWTLPAHASLFTGLYVAAHGTDWEHLVLDDDLATLPDILRTQGYDTIGFSGNDLVSASRGFARGFGEFANITAQGGALLERIRQVVAADRANPFFLFINLIEPHDPYDSSGRFLGSYLTDAAYRNTYRVGLLDYVANPSKFPSELLGHLEEHYDAELRFCDSVIEEIAKELKAKGMWDSTVFIVTSDHGEAFGEHGLVTHQFSLYESHVRIPLVVRYPPRIPPGSRNHTPVQLVDLFPTILELSGMDPGLHPSHGYSLVRPDPPVDRPILAEYGLHEGFQPADPSNPYRVRKEWGDLWKTPEVQDHNHRIRALRVNAMKLIARSDGREELYDLSDDPGETTDLAGRPDPAGRLLALRSRLDELVRRYQADRGPRPAAPAPGREDIEKLKALGYL